MVLNHTMVPTHVLRKKRYNFASESIQDTEVKLLMSHLKKKKINGQAKNKPTDTE